jgi:phage terminase large subunit-like protein
VQVPLADGTVESIAAVSLPEGFDQVVQSWDLAFKDLATSDYVVGQVWAARGADRFLLDQRRERMDMPRTVEAIRGMSEQWPRAAAKLVEDRANGPAVIATLKHDIAGLIAVNALTQALNRLQGASRAIYPVLESEIVIDPIPIPAHWPCVFGMDARLTETAALWGAFDPTADILYVYSEHCQSSGEPAIHAHGIGSRGKWIPGLLDPKANGRSPSDGFNLLRIYQELGLNLDVAMDSEQSGVCEVLQRGRAGRLKVFRTLGNFFQQYRLYRRDEHGQVVKQNDLLMNCLRYLCVSGRDRMCTEPTPWQEWHLSEMQPGTPGGWMR